MRKTCKSDKRIKLHEREFIITRGFENLRGLRMAFVEQTRKEGWYRKGATDDDGKDETPSRSPLLVID